MKNTTEQLKQGLSQLSFMIPTLTSNEQRQEAHQIVIDLLVLAGQLDARAVSTPRSTVAALGSNESMAQEINKVKRRLKLWATRPHQVNTKLLCTFLKLQESPSSSVPLETLASTINDPTKFATNFNQMCVIASNNHGKIFVVNDGDVSLWEPIADDVLTFKDTMLKNGELP